MLPSSGLISFRDLNIEMSFPADQEVSLGDSPMRGLSGIASGATSLSDFHGKANRAPVSLTISSATNNYTLNPSKIAGYVAGLMDIAFVVNSGVVIGSTSTGSTALTITGFAAGDTVTVTNNGYIVGKGGNGGSANGGGGGGGGRALSTYFAVSMTNNGTIGGGGGGGGGGGRSLDSDGATTPSYFYTNGSGGGGAAGRNSGSGGWGRVYGSSGSLTSGGAGGSAGSWGAAGGSGGALGSNGGGGASGNNTGGGGGGSGGACTLGNSYITWITTGTRAGALN